jgi:hypothetical protein
MEFVMTNTETNKAAKVEKIIVTDTNIYINKDGAVCVIAHSKAKEITVNLSF